VRAGGRGTHWINLDYLFFESATRTASKRSESLILI
jgi:hypothetical protein